MTPKEAINCIKDVLGSDYHYDETLGYQLTSDDFEWLELAIEALEKQMAKKPILKNGETLVHLNKGNNTHEWQLNKWQDWVCPVCGWFVGQRYNASQAHSHDQRKSKFCNKCGQAIDWSEEE